MTNLRPQRKTNDTFFFKKKHCQNKDAGMQNSGENAELQEGNFVPREKSRVSFGKPHK
jgi:hypothetical protein